MASAPVLTGGALSSANEVGGVLGFGGVSIAGMHEEDSYYSFNLAAGITIANVGFCVAVDPTGPTQAKLCGANDIILGRLETVETRVVEGINVGAVTTEGGMVVPLDTTAGATLPAVGDSVQGGTVPGTVVKLAAAQGRNNVVVSVDTVGMTAVVLFL